MEFRLTQEILETIDQYVKGNLDGEQMKAFERELESNSALKEEMLIQKRLFHALENQNMATDEAMDIDKKLSNPEYQELSNKIRNIGTEYLQESSTEIKPLWVRFKQLIPAAAAILVIVIISTVYLTTMNPSIDQYYYDSVNWETELVSFTEKGDSKSDFTDGEAFFRSKEYSKAIQSFETINPEDEMYAYSLMYIGASHANLNQNQQALQAFEQLAEMREFAESSKGLWYVALIHLKLESKAKAIEMLKKISQDSSNYRYEDALKIMKEIE